MKVMGLMTMFAMVVKLLFLRVQQVLDIAG